MSIYLSKNYCFSAKITSNTAPFHKNMFLRYEQQINTFRRTSPFYYDGTRPLLATLVTSPAKAALVGPARLSILSLSLFTRLKNACLFARVRRRSQFDRSVFGLHAPRRGLGAVEEEDDDSLAGASYAIWSTRNGATGVYY